MTVAHMRLKIKVIGQGLRLGIQLWLNIDRRR